MATMKELALQASNEAFQEEVKTAISTLLSSFILAKTPEERAACVEKHKTGLLLCKAVHEASVAAIQEVFS